MAPRQYRGDEEHREAFVIAVAETYGVPLVHLDESGAGLDLHLRAGL